MANVTHKVKQKRVISYGAEANAPQPLPNAQENKENIKAQNSAQNSNAANKQSAPAKKAEPNYKSMFIASIIVIVILLIVVFIQYGINKSAQEQMTTLQQQLSEYQTSVEVSTDANNN